jgi:hypothetical protein
VTCYTCTLNHTCGYQYMSTSTHTPPVVPGIGNNIIISPLQVPYSPSRQTSVLELLTARKHAFGLHSECWQGIWGHHCRLPSRKDNRSVVSEVRVCHLASEATEEVLMFIWQPEVSSSPSRIYPHPHRKTWPLLQSEDPANIM